MFRVRAAAAGNSVRRSGVLVKITLIRSSVVARFRSQHRGDQFDDRADHLVAVVGAKLGRTPHGSDRHHCTLAIETPIKK